MPVAGVDVGSLAAKAVIFDPQSRSLLGKAVLPTGWNAREAGEKALAAACADAGGIAASRIVGTGSGRISLSFADKVVTEITCHARGAVHLFPGTGRGSSRACPCPYASGHARKRIRKNSSRQGYQETPRGLPFSTNA